MKYERHLIKFHFIYYNKIDNFVKQVKLNFAPEVKRKNGSEIPTGISEPNEMTFIHIEMFVTEV